MTNLKITDVVLWRNRPAVIERLARDADDSQILGIRIVGSQERHAVRASEVRRHLWLND